MDRSPAEVLSVLSAYGQQLESAAQNGGNQDELAFRLTVKGDGFVLASRYDWLWRTAVRGRIGSGSHGKSAELRGRVEAFGQGCKLIVVTIVDSPSRLAILMSTAGVTFVFSLIAWFMFRADGIVAATELIAVFGVSWFGFLAALVVLGLVFGGSMKRDFLLGILRRDIRGQNTG